MDAILGESVTDTKLLHNRKASVPIVVTLGGIVIDVKLLQL